MKNLDLTQKISKLDTGAKFQGSSSKLNRPGYELTGRFDTFGPSTSKNVYGASSLAIVSEKIEKSLEKREEFQPLTKGERFQNKVGVSPNVEIHLHQELSQIENVNEHQGLSLNEIKKKQQELSPEENEQQQEISEIEIENEQQELSQLEIETEQPSLNSINPDIGNSQHFGENQQTEEENVIGLKFPLIPVSFTINLFIIMFIFYSITFAIINTCEETKIKKKIVVIVIERFTRVARHILPIYWLTKTSEIRAYALRKIKEWLINNYSIEFSEKVMSYISKM